MIFIAAELDVLLFGNQLHAAELILIEREQPLIAQIVHGFIEAGLDVAGDSEHPRIAVQHGVRAAISRRVVTDLQLADFAALAGDVHFEGGRVEAVG